MPRANHPANHRAQSARLVWQQSHWLSLTSFSLAVRRHNPMGLLKLSDIAPREIAPGYQSRLIHSERMTHSYVDIRAGMPLPRHSHPHEQVLNMLEGRFELVVDGVPYVLEPGDVFVIPPDVPHSGHGLTDCRILDVFTPVREDYR